MVPFLMIYCLLCLLVAPAVAWGPRYEPVKGGYGISTQLKASERDHSHDRDLVDNTFALHFEETDTYVDGELFQSRMFISKPLLWEPHPHDGIHFAFFEDDVCGEDCEEDECPIPEEYKLAAKESAVDVMAFLGIHRAEPLQVEPKIRDWD